MRSLLALLLLAAVTRADLPSPRLDRIAPLGAAAGTSVEVEVVGNDIEDTTKLIFDHPGITAKHIKDRKFTVTVGADVPAGTYDARLVGRYGVTNPRLFAVQRGMAEVTEAATNEDREKAQAVAVNGVVNGTSKGGKESVFRFPAKKGQRVVAECFAQRLDSQLDGVLTITDAAGRSLASNSDYSGKDPLAEFVAPADADYFVVLSDLTLRGGHPYRLVISDKPHVEKPVPARCAGRQEDGPHRVRPQPRRRGEAVGAHPQRPAARRPHRERHPAGRHPPARAVRVHRPPHRA